LDLKEALQNPPVTRNFDCDVRFAPVTPNLVREGRVDAAAKALALFIPADDVQALSLKE
jgi:hypothetical protein